MQQFLNLLPIMQHLHSFDQSFSLSAVSVSSELHSTSITRRLPCVSHASTIQETAAMILALLRSSSCYSGNTQEYYIMWLGYALISHRLFWNILLFSSRDLVCHGESNVTISATFARLQTWSCSWFLTLHAEMGM